MGEGSRLEFQQLEPTPPAKGKDFILTSEDLSDSLCRKPPQCIGANLEAIRLLKQLEQEISGTQWKALALLCNSPPPAKWLSWPIQNGT